MTTPAVQATPEPPVQPVVPDIRICADPDGRPIIMLPSATVSINESAGQLFRVIAPNQRLFHRAGGLVEIVEMESGFEISNLSPIAAQSRFEEYARFEKLRRVGRDVLPQPARLTRANAEELIASTACRVHLPVLHGVVNCCLLVERDGQLHMAGRGYDPVTGLYVASESNPEEVSLQDAVDTLTTMLEDFDFVSPGDRSRALASTITPALKLGGFIRGNVPMDVAEANESQSGKTYRQRLVGAVYNQTLAVVTQRKGGVGSMEETLADHLAKGRSFIQFDNLRDELNSQYLESLLTADRTFSARIPYRGSVEIDPSKFIIFLSSNGFASTPDLINRSSIIRIRKRPDGHVFANYDGLDTLAYVETFQPLFLGSVFRVVREWFGRGKLRTAETRHNFREWCQICDWIVQNLFGAAPLMEGHDEASTRAANPHLTFLRSVAMVLEQQGLLGQELTASNLAETCVAANLLIPDLSPEQQNGQQGPRVIGRIMRGLFDEGNVQVVENYRVTRSVSNEQSQAGNSQPITRYTFELVVPVGVPVPVQAVR